MEFVYSKSLGVDCRHCHVTGQWEKDDNPKKQIARDMYDLMLLTDRNAVSSAPDSILILEERFKTALLNRDAAAIEALLADDLVHVGFEGQIAGRTEYMAFFKTGEWRYTKYSLSQVSVKALPATAVVTGQVNRSIIVAGKETTGAFAFTHVWVQSGKTWRLTSSHVTTVPQK